MSVPLRMGKKIIAHHTLLPCTGAAMPTPGKKEAEYPVEVGDVVWAKGCMLPGWPGRVVSYQERGMSEPPKDKVGF